MEVSILEGKVLDSRVPWAAAGTLASPEPTLDDYLLPSHMASAPLGQTQGLCHLSGWGVAETPEPGAWLAKASTHLPPEPSVSAQGRTGARPALLSQ